MVDTRWLNFLYSTLWKNVKVQKKDITKFHLSLFCETMCFSNPREMSFSVLGLMVLGISWAAPENPLPHGSISVPWLVLSNPQKTLCSWRRVSCTWEPFLQFWAFLQFLTQTGRMLLAPHWAPNVTGCSCLGVLGPGDVYLNESQILKCHSYHSLLPISHMMYITVHKILWAQTLAHIKTLKHSVLRGQSSHSTTKINESYFELNYPMIFDDKIYQKYYKW